MHKNLALTQAKCCPNIAEPSSIVVKELRTYDPRKLRKRSLLKNKFTFLRIRLTPAQKNGLHSNKNYIFLRISLISKKKGLHSKMTYVFFFLRIQLTLKNDLVFF